jgi:hypothetical protein
MKAAELEALSWRLASELMRRHPDELRLIRGHPSGGQYDLLWLLPLTGRRCEIRLNRAGTIQVSNPRDADSSQPGWQPMGWEEFAWNDLIDIVRRLEIAAELPSPSRARTTTPVTLTYRVLAQLAGLGAETGPPFSITCGYIDTSGCGGGPNHELNAFSIPRDLLARREGDLFGEPGYRFWMASRDDAPMLAFEQSSGLAWARGGTPPIDLMAIYRTANRDLAAVTTAVLAMLAPGAPTCA